MRKGRITRTKKISVAIVLVAAISLGLTARHKSDSKNVLSGVRDQASTKRLLEKAERLQKRGDLRGAVAVFSQISQDFGKLSIAARMSQASTLLHLGELLKCEQQLVLLSEIDPQNRYLPDLRNGLLTASGRRWESKAALEALLLRPGTDARSVLIHLASIDQMPAPDEDYFERVMRVGDPYGQLAGGRVAAAIGDYDRALELYRQCLKALPNLVEANVQIGAALLDSGRVTEFDNWQAGLTEAADPHPTVWLLRGRRAQERGDQDVALRCYWECLKRHPNQDRACYQIGQILAGRNDTTKAAPFLARAGLLSSLIEESEALYDRKKGDVSLRKCAEACRDLGRCAEAIGWCQLLAESKSYDAQRAAARIVSEVRELDVNDSLFLAAGFDLSQRFSFADMPLPATDKPVADISPSVVAEPSAATNFSFSFVNEAKARGISFAYHNGASQDNNGRRMFEYTGGGCGVIDIDNDLWPDLHFTQGCDWPPSQDQSKYMDQIYRNVRGGGFVEVAQESGVMDNGFGQGVAVGDYNNDGFDDLYVANIRGNELYRNNGDGTFDNVTQAASLGHEYWTTSCMIADVDLDGTPDIYDVTFLHDDRVFTAICKGEDGIPRSCAPEGFGAAPDVVFEGLGDGRFRPFPDDSGLDAPDGDGLGIVAADFDNSDNLSIFVANDGRPNFLFRMTGLDSSGSPKWENTALTTGAAFDEVGSPQACMGVAAEDINRDGYTDLFVTNFYNESNTLYANMQGAAFLDQTRSLGLREPSMKSLGFGTQFGDVDLDGWFDILLVNGHVDDFSHDDLPYKMPPQAFRNVAGRRFYEMDAEQLGPYFQSEWLGRGMASVDWNGDLRPDFVVSNLFDPAALLTNSTPSRLPAISVRLIGKKLSRDAFGSRVSIMSDQGEYARQLTAGNGYHASNERTLSFAMLSPVSESSLRISWLGGSTDNYGPVRAGTTYAAIEATNRLLALPR